MEQNQNENIEKMMEALSTLECLPKEQRSPEYNEIIIRMKEYINNHCIHDITYDMIDIDYERSQTIRYCQICYKTFPLTLSKDESTN